MIEKIKNHCKKNSDKFFEIPGVVGHGVGLNKNGNSDVCLIFYVESMTDEHKKMKGKKKIEDGTEIDVEVMEVGKIEFTSFDTRQRPMKYGASIGHFAGTRRGTFGVIATDLLDNTEVILSTCHVLANSSTGVPGDAILQPAPAVGGVNPEDQVGTLKRFVPLNLNDGDTNYVDAALATPIPGSYTKASNCSPINLKKVFAVGLTYAAGTNITVINPIQTVLTMLNCSLPRVKEATVGMALQKCGAGTEYSTATVSSIHTSVTLTMSTGARVTFVDQIITAGGVGSTASGDSGAIWYTM